MTKAKLTSEEEAKLNVVLGFAGDIESRVGDGIRIALVGVTDGGRRKYLGNLLRRLACRRIRNARKKFAPA